MFGCVAELKEYLQLLADKDYIDVQFNPATGGLQATHVLHGFHPKTGHFEKEVRDLLFENGDKIILGKERAAKGEKVQEGVKHIDGHFNDLPCDITAISGTGRNTIKKALQHCRSKGAEVAILYFPNSSIYTEERLLTGISMYNGATKHRFREVIVIYDKKVHKKSHP